MNYTQQPSDYDKVHNTQSGVVIAVKKYYIIFRNTGSRCLECWGMYYQTANIIQYEKSSCIGDSTTSPTSSTYDALCSPLDNGGSVTTFFRQGYEPQNCKTWIEGQFHFTYEVDKGGGGICDSRDSVVNATQRQGSAYLDNTYLIMTFGVCPGIMNTGAPEVRYNCLGSWFDQRGNTWAALVDSGEQVKRFRYRCINTRYDQLQTGLKFRIGMSRMASCSELSNYYDAPYRLILDPMISQTQLTMMAPTCLFPANFSGTWYTTGEYDVFVTINQTHIRYWLQLDQFHWQETYFTCKQQRESRYLTMAITNGRFEVDYVCFDFMPRHHSIVRFRMGRPFRHEWNDASELGSDFMVWMFRRACHWSSFTLNQVNWTYNTFIMNPPSPVDCPIQGRYTFIMNGQKNEKYFTKIPGGITVRPRVRVDCLPGNWESDLAVCLQDSKHMKLDVERCMYLDNFGRPLNEYDYYDNLLTCVGYWMEDLKSYLITYDPDDPVSRSFRCWVYRRTDYKQILMSRSVRARCPAEQSPYSNTPDEGASLLLELYLNEREFDGCPINFDDGKDPYALINQLKILGGHALPASRPLALLLFFAALVHQFV
jgi:hypothetical protein